MTAGGAGSMSDLPPPGEIAALQSQRVVAHVVESIAAAGGWWSFAEYHDCVLHAPGLGYYSAGASKFGAAGDFVTAPELSRLFTRTCATQLDLCLRVHGGDLLEIGPGTGSFAAETLEIFAFDNGVLWLKSSSTKSYVEVMVFSKEIVVIILNV